MNYPALPENIYRLLKKGAVIPALPLALNKNRKLDEKRQRALLRYYLDAGAGGVAVAVHTTQFAIRYPGINLFERILKIAREEFDVFTDQHNAPVVRIAGATGKTGQAVKEAELALENGYHAVLLSLAAFAEAPNEELISHCKTIAGIIPLVGFYLQPAVGGRILDADFWREFSQIENVIAIKVAPFNRYQTLDVVRGVVESGRSEEIALYTGNDDNILIDLLTEFVIPTGNKIIKKRIVGGLLGHWAVWTKSAVRLLERVKRGDFEGNLPEALTLAAQITDCNAAFFDTANHFAGCIAGIHEVLRRQGLLEGNWTLDPGEGLSPGQLAEINRVYVAYPHLNDDDFVAGNLNKWLR